MLLLLQMGPASCSFDDLLRDCTLLLNHEVVLHGYLGTRRDASKTLTFAELRDMHLRSSIQLVSTLTEGQEGSDTAHQQLRLLAEHTPVAITGTVKPRKAPRATTSPGRPGTLITGAEVKVEKVTPLNAFPKDIIMNEDTVFPAEQRHLQLRNDAELRNALAFRSRVARKIRDELGDRHGFIEVETPLLFKSTPEGAREFLVPSRSPGMAYALPQSPQQYKQILMASGIPRYLQIAKCFRDEDLRADRQPEFSQVDLEMAFATGEDVMNVMESVIKMLWSDLLQVDLPDKFARMTYHEAMSRYGSDKPDLRLGCEIRRIEYMLPVDLIQKIGPLDFPIVEVMKIPISDDTQQTRKFVNTFMESPEAQPFIQNPEGQPGIFIVDSRKPLQGLQPFGFEAAEQLEETLSLEDGDLVVIQARKDAPFSGGATPMGNLRLALHKAAVRHNYIAAPPPGFAFTWITDFPLFSPTAEDEPGQGGAAGITATHHPFTAPKTPEDVDLLVTDPLQVTADHYDLVVNGVELGGGSRRIHNAAMQEYIMREVLRMSDERMQDFTHLIEVLRAGCPPHAGMALGFDRLIAVMLGKESVRDAIAFPKSGKGEDVLVKSPARMTAEQLETYHLQLK
ncbi:Aspartate--tRNA ligase [Sphaerulina musiva]